VEQSPKRTVPIKVSKIPDTLFDSASFRYMQKHKFNVTIERHMTDRSVAAARGDL
jgi:hypothetical protein